MLGIINLESTLTLNITTFRFKYHNAAYCYAECLSLILVYTECHLAQYRYNGYAAFRHAGG